MSILSWDKPKQKLTKKQWAEAAGFEDGPTGGYVPNMSDEDNARWKAKVTGQKLGFPQVEIRKAAGPSQMTIIVNLGDGYNYKQYRVVNDDWIGKTPADFSSSHHYTKLYDTQKKIDRYAFQSGSTRGQQVHIALNGPAQMSFDEARELHLVIEEAKAKLEELTGVKGERKCYVLLVDDLTMDLSGVEGLTEHYRLPGYSAIVVTAPPALIGQQRDGVEFVTEAEFTERLEADYEEDRKSW